MPSKDQEKSYGAIFAVIFIIGVLIFIGYQSFKELFEKRISGDVKSIEEVIVEYEDLEYNPIQREDVENKNLTEEEIRDIVQSVLREELDTVKRVQELEEEF